MAETVQRNFRLRTAARIRLERLEAKLGIDQTAVLHLAIQRLEEQEFPPENSEKKPRKKT